MLGNFFEDFRIGQKFRHASPRTVTTGDVALYTALTGSRFAVNSSTAFARAIGFSDAPVDDLLVFHIVFGKTVPDISFNAVANLGYAELRFGASVHPGDTLAAESEVIGLKPTSDGRSGIVWVRSRGINQRGEMVVEFARWVMVMRRAPGTRATTEAVVPALAEAVAARDLIVPMLDLRGYDFELAGDTRRWADYAPGMRLDHVIGTTVEEAEHQLATRLYQNTARVHFDAVFAAAGRFGRRLVYGGHVISVARAASFNGLANAFRVAAINGGRHVAPVMAGDTVYAWTEVLDRLDLPARTDLGALRLRTIATKNQPCADFPPPDHPAVVLDLDYTVLVPR
ncbi:MAG TPA: MaoC family dehydratase [Alphaproteobacteria bacterium]